MTLQPRRAIRREEAPKRSSLSPYRQGLLVGYVVGILAGAVLAIAASQVHPLLIIALGLTFILVGLSLHGRAEEERHA